MGVKPEVIVWHVKEGLRPKDPGAHLQEEVHVLLKEGRLRGAQLNAVQDESDNSVALQWAMVYFSESAAGIWIFVLIDEHR